MKSSRAIGLILLGIAFINFGLPAYAQSTDIVPLNGSWLTLAGDDIQRGAVSVKENDWKTVTLPTPTASSGFVWYRKHFEVPASWETDSMVVQQHKLLLHLGTFEGALNVYLNGYHVQALGAVPTDPKGSGYSAGPEKSDVEIGIATQAPVAGQNVNLFNFGKDNVIAFQVYAPEVGKGFTGGDIGVEKPNLSLVYPYSRQLSSDDGLFDTSHLIKFTVSLGNRTANPINDTLAISATDDEGNPPTGFTPSSGPVSIDAHIDEQIGSTFGFGEPGFYNISVKVTADGHAIPDDDFVVGFNALSIDPPDTRPSDYRTFWNSVIKDALASTSSTSGTGGTSSNFSFVGIDGKEVEGWLTLPSNADGKVPVVVEFPAYNTDFTGPDTSLENKGIATLCVNVDQSFVGPTAHTVIHGVDDPNTYAYRTIVGNALRCIASLPSSQFDKQRIGLAGVDQGAMIALAVASFDPAQIKAVYASGPLFAFPTHSLKVATAGPYTTLRQYVATHGSAYKTLTYFDLVNAVSSMTAVVDLQVGLMDDVTPPSGVYAVSNKITSVQKTVVSPTAIHPAGNDFSGGMPWLIDHL
jgi:cephalosporin-C deacetylase